MSAPEPPHTAGRHAVDEPNALERQAGGESTNDEPAAESTDPAAEPLADTAEAVSDTADAVIETEAAVLATDGAVTETGDAVLETPRVADAADGATGAAVVTIDDEPKPRMDLAQLKSIVEALIFASPEPLTPKMLLKLLNDEPKEDVLAGIEAVKQDYETRPGLHVAEVAGGYQITTRPELHDWVRRLFHERTIQKLSVASLETLSVIAYKQPITQAEIGEIRGVNTSGVLTTLLERHLIKIVGRKNVIGRPFLYGTTREFLIRFGLKDVTDLPKIEDMAQQLGFEPPASLMEQNIPEDMLPLEEEPGAADDEDADAGGDPSMADEAGSDSAPEGTTASNEAGEPERGSDGHSDDDHFADAGTPEEQNDDEEPRR